MRIRIFFSLLMAIAFLVLVGGAVVLAVYAVDDHPLAASKIELTTDDITRARLLLYKYDPRNLRERDISHLTINTREANILLSYMMDHLRRSNPLLSGINRIAAQMDIRTETAELRFTIGLPETLSGGYLNIDLVFAETKEKPEIRQISIGDISLSGGWMKPVLYLGEKLTQRIGFAQETALVLGVIKTVQLRPNELTLVYEWRSEVARKLTEKGRSLLISDQDRESLIAYNNQIAVTSRGVVTKEAPLIYFMKPVFELAQLRSGASSAPRAENRAAILALSMFVNNRPIAPLIGNPAGRSLPKPKEVKTTLGGRTDLPKHFMISAAMTILADSDLSNVVGLFKEIDDSIGGSGFSFVDLLADRAGVRFAELCAVNDEQARWVQQTVIRGVRESDFMPGIDGLTEGLMKKTFQQRYRDLDSAAFRAEKQEIERRIDACPLFKSKR
ncbi:MAG: hypothetical protein V2B19_30105 [Pseudomonadota bacterium]